MFGELHVVGEHFVNCGSEGEHIKNLNNMQQDVDNITIRKQIIKRVGQYVYLGQTLNLTKFGHNTENEH